MYVMVVMIDDGDSGGRVGVGVVGRHGLRSSFGYSV